MARTNRPIRSIFKSRAHMEVLVAVADNRSMLAAAMELHSTQPAVSRVIQKLEEEAGAPLFERRINGSAPTMLGAYAVARARLLLRHGGQRPRA